VSLGRRGSGVRERCHYIDSMSGSKLRVRGSDLKLADFMRRNVPGNAETRSVINFVDAGHQGVVKVRGALHVRGDAQTCCMGFLYDDLKQRWIQTLPPKVLCIVF